MSRHLLGAGCAALALAVPAKAQLSGPRSAFVPAISPSVGPMIFGHRLAQATNEAGYRSSIALAVRAEHPLSRRTGLMAHASVAPFSAQVTESDGANRAIWSKAIVYRVDAGLSWRFKPAAPVFFYGGGGLVGATRYGWPNAEQLSGSVLEPQAALAVGYDAGSRGRWNFRATYAGYFVFPSTVEGSGVEAKTLAYDWSLQLGARYALRPGRS